MSALLTILLAVADPAAAAQPAVEEKSVCRTERSLGSRVAKQVCRTPSQARRDAEEARRKLDLGNKNPAPPAAFKAPEKG